MAAHDFVDENLVLEPTEWETDNSSEEFCICGTPSTDEMIFCSSSGCPIAWFHRKCVGLADDFVEDWICEFCDSDSASVSARGIGSGSSSTAPVLSSGKPGNSSMPEPGPKETAKQAKPILPRFGALMKPREEILANAHYFARDALEDLRQDEVYLNTVEGQKIVKLASDIDYNGEDFNEAAEVITKDLLEIVMSAEGKLPGSSANCAIIKNYQVYQTSSRSYNIFVKLLGSDNQSTKFFQQYVLRAMLEKIMKDSVKEDFDAGAPVDKLSREEEQALRYLAGYIPFALHRRYSKLQSNPAKELAAFLNGWRKDDDDDTNADTFLHYTSVWLTYQNRGGLFVVSDNVYLFFRSIEFVSRRLFVGNCLQGGETIKEKLIKHLCGSTHVQRMWGVLSSELCKNLAESLFQTIIQYWIKIRVSAYVRSYVSIVKNQERNDRKSKKSLRKGLKGKQKDASL
ncbi:uncharacterized protein LOC121413213 [Lytechinus variegatus]|uniref:uncharacterized protein LOC121413213 n=1 Tax=Lytechinus variegatus TaxID=7654 RepID=UPI001BB0E247|nr:uncharacterized protein LOC121413213 [Lytechinus variegatus]